MAEKERLTKFTIRQSLKALQERRNFATLDELAAAVAEDLADEGFLLDVEDQAKIRKIVEDEGYTGRFAIDDWLRRRFKGSRLLPWISLAAAALLFIISSVVGAKIEGLVQGPTKAAASSQVTAVFQAPSTTSEREVPFKLLLSNQGSEPLHDLAVFISGPGPVAEFHVDHLDPKQPKSLEGNFKVKPGETGTATLVAYVVAPGFSLKSEPVQVALQGAYVADVGGPGREVDGAAPEANYGEMAAPQAQRRPAGPAAHGKPAPAKGGASAVALESAAPSLARESAAPQKPAPPQAAPPTDLHPVNSTTEVDLLAAQCAAMPLEAPERAALKSILQAYASSGVVEAQQALTKL